MRICNLAGIFSPANKSRDFVNIFDTLMDIVLTRGVIITNLEINGVVGAVVGTVTALDAVRGF